MVMHKSFEQLITGVTHNNDEFIIGFSNGHVEFQTCNELENLTVTEAGSQIFFKNKCLPPLSDWVPRRRQASCALEFALSPNSTCLAYQLHSGDLVFSDMSKSRHFLRAVMGNDVTITAKAIANELTLAILNHRDHADIENLVRAAAETTETKLHERVLEESFHNIEQLYPKGVESLSNTEYVQRLLGAQLSFLRYMNKDKDENIQYKNTFALQQLQAVNAVFTHILQKNDLKFDSEDLQVCIDIISWFMEFLVYFVQNVYEFYHTEEEGRNLANECTPLALLFNTSAFGSIKCVINVIRILSTHNAHEHATYGASDLRRDLENVLAGSCVPYDQFDAFLDKVKEIIDEKMNGISNRQQIEFCTVLRSVLASPLEETLTPIQLVFDELCSSVDVLAVCLSRPSWLSKVDVVRKSKLKTRDRACLRCGSQSAESWEAGWLSVYQRTCVCGGLWKLTKTT